MATEDYSNLSRVQLTAYQRKFQSILIDITLLTEHMTVFFLRVVNEAILSQVLIISICTCFDIIHAIRHPQQFQPFPKSKRDCAWYDRSTVANPSDLLLLEDHDYIFGYLFLEKEKYKLRQELRKLDVAKQFFHLKSHLIESSWVEPSSTGSILKYPLFSLHI